MFDVGPTDWQSPAALFAEPRAAPDLLRVHAEHVDFVWRTLQRLGARDAELPDLSQEVFLVVHQRLHTYDPSQPMTGWLYGICRNVHGAHRRRAYHRREAAGELPEVEDGRADVEESVALRRARAQLDEILAAMDPDKRVVFTMFELEEQSCDAIAAALGIPTGTVHSRLHAARKIFQRALAKRSSREGVDRGGSSAPPVPAR